MSEGPQTRLRAAWLARTLEGRRMATCRVQRDALELLPCLLSGRRVTRVFPHGKHIFLEFEGDLFLHNHLLMRGTWTRSSGQLLFLRPDAWLAMTADGGTVCNLRGQMLRIEDRETLEASLADLGPDLMAEPSPRSEIQAALLATTLPIGEALLDPSVAAGAGNVYGASGERGIQEDQEMPQTSAEEPAGGTEAQGEACETVHRAR